MKDYIRRWVTVAPPNSSYATPQPRRHSRRAFCHRFLCLAEGCRSVAHGLEREAHAAQREINLLDPNWLTGAIYGLITSKLVGNQDGELGRDQISQILDPKEYPPNRHEFILDMMKAEDLSLCFEIPGSNGRRYLIPEALRVNQPDYGVWPEDSLRFRYDYDLLPIGLMPRFIVQAHRNLTDHPTRWKTGVVLGAAGCKILVRADRDKNRIDILVAGHLSRRRAALNVVLNDLEEVHRKNRGIGENALVPLPDQPDAAESYGHLLTLEEEDGLDHEYRPRDAKRRYTVRELLEGVRREPGRTDREERVYVSKIEVKIGDGATFHGDFAVGEKIRNSFNKAAVAATSEDIKAALQQLAQEVAKIAKNLSDEQAADLADDLGRLTDEATKETPKKKWWEVSAKGIKDAATTVGTVGKVAIDLVKRIEGLLT